MEYKTVPIQTLQRLPSYLNYLKSLPKDGPSNVSATIIADALGLNDVQVRKDLSSISGGGRPKVGYIIEDLITDLEQFLGYSDENSAVIVGAGNLGRALLSYEGFSEYGLDIVAAFDIDETIVGTTINDKQILPCQKLGDLCNRLKIKIGVITVPARAAQEVCDTLVESGVLAIWNFAPLHLHVPEGVLVQNENMACSLAILFKSLRQRSLY